jgi:2-dehydropantoate 2-reductase
MNVLIFGAGALGSYLGAKISTKCDVLLIGRGDHARCVKDGGLVVLEDKRRDTLKLRMEERVTDGKWDVIVITTKTYDTMMALETVLPFIDDHTLLVLFQNGIGLEEQVGTVFKTKGIGPVLARGITSQGFLLERPGVLRHTGPGDTWFGRYPEGTDKRLDAFVGLLRASGWDAGITSDIKKEIWIKGLVNACINPLTAITGRPNGILLENPLLASVMRMIYNEGLAVAQRAVDLKGVDVWEKVLEVVRRTSQNNSSMLQDVINNRPTEIESITGEIIRRGDAYSIPVPTNRSIYLLIKNMSSKKDP